MALADTKTVYKDEMCWAFFRSDGTKWHQTNKCTQGSASAVGMATLTGQIPEHIAASKVVRAGFPDKKLNLRLLLRWIDDLLR